MRLRGEWLKRLPKTKIWERTCGTESKAGSQMWFQISRTRIGTSRTKKRFLGIWALKPRFHDLWGEKFSLFRRASGKCESTCVNQLSILFHRCGLRILLYGVRSRPCLQLSKTHFWKKNTSFRLKVVGLVLVVEQQPRRGLSLWSSLYPSDLVIEEGAAVCMHTPILRARAREREKEKERDSFERKL